MEHSTADYCIEPKRVGDVLNRSRSERLGAGCGPPVVLTVPTESVTPGPIEAPSRAGVGTQMLIPMVIAYLLASPLGLSVGAIVPPPLASTVVLLHRFCLDLQSTSTVQPC